MNTVDDYIDPWAAVDIEFTDGTSANKISDHHYVHQEDGLYLRTAVGIKFYPWSSIKCIVYQEMKGSEL